MLLKNQRQRELRVKKENEQKYAVTRHVTKRIRVYQNENEKRGCMWLENMRQREQRNKKISYNENYKRQ